MEYEDTILVVNHDKHHEELQGHCIHMMIKEGLQQHTCRIYIMRKDNLGC
jgi:hypothetical protein